MLQNRVAAPVKNEPSRRCFQALQSSGEASHGVSCTVKLPCENGTCYAPSEGIFFTLNLGSFCQRSSVMTDTPTGLGGFFDVSNESAKRRSLFPSFRPNLRRDPSFTTTLRFSGTASRPPSRPGELHPEALTDPDLSLSTHPARAIQ